MPVIAETAYPRLPAEPEPAELEAFTPEPAEIAFARQKTRQPGPRLALLVLLKTFQRLGRVVRFADGPTGIIDQIRAAVGLASNTGELVGYGDTTYRVRLAALVRGYVGVTGYNREARGIAGRAASRRRAPATTWLISSMPASRSCCASAAKCPPSARSSNSPAPPAPPAPWSTAPTTVASRPRCRPTRASAWPPCSWCPRAPTDPAGTR